MIYIYYIIAKAEHLNTVRTTDFFSYLLIIIHVGINDFEPHPNEQINLLPIVHWGPADGWIRVAWIMNEVGSRCDDDVHKGLDSQFVFEILSKLLMDTILQLEDRRSLSFATRSTASTKGQLWRWAVSLPVYLPTTSTHLGFRIPTGLRNVTLKPEICGAFR